MIDTTEQGNSGKFASKPHEELIESWRSPDFTAQRLQWADHMGYATESTPRGIRIYEVQSQLNL